MVFAISDLHLSLGSNKPMDIFPGWQDYVARLEKNWRAIVGEGDTVVIAGDISWAMKLPEAEQDFAFLHGLPGRKIILKGNHDLWWMTAKKMQEFFREKGFDSLQLLHNNAVPMPEDGICVCGTRGWFFDAEDADAKVLLREAGRLETSVKLGLESGLEPVVFLHYPPIYNGMSCHEMLGVLQKYSIKRCYYGHIHGKSAGGAVQGEAEGILFKLISCDFTGFSPIRVT